MADIHRYKMIVLPDYELIIVKCKKEINKDGFSKLIPNIVQKEKDLSSHLKTGRTDKS